MWIAKQTHEDIKATVRIGGKFAPDNHHSVAMALFEWGWLSIMDSLIHQCRNRAAVAALDSHHAECRLWLDRANKLAGIE